MSWEKVLVIRMSSPTGSPDPPPGLYTPPEAYAGLPTCGSPHAVMLTPHQIKNAHQRNFGVMSHPASFRLDFTPLITRPSLS